MSFSFGEFSHPFLGKSLWITPPFLSQKVQCKSKAQRQQLPLSCQGHKLCRAMVRAMQRAGDAQDCKDNEEPRLCACQRKSQKAKSPVGFLPITSMAALDSHKD